MEVNSANIYLLTSVTCYSTVKNKSPAHITSIVCLVLIFEAFFSPWRIQNLFLLISKNIRIYTTRLCISFEKKKNSRQWEGSLRKLLELSLRSGCKAAASWDTWAAEVLSDRAGGWTYLPSSAMWRSGVCQSDLLVNGVGKLPLDSVF